VSERNNSELNKACLEIVIGLSGVEWHLQASGFKSNYDKTYWHFILQCLPYTLLLRDLEVSNLRELEVRASLTTHWNLLVFLFNLFTKYLCSATSGYLAYMMLKVIMSEW